MLLLVSSSSSLEWHPPRGYSGLAAPPIAQLFRLSQGPSLWMLEQPCCLRSYQKRSLGLQAFQYGPRGVVPVDAVRRYSKQPHLWRSSKRLEKLLSSPRERRAEPTPSPRHVHKLAQRLTAEEVSALQEAYRAGASLAELQQRFYLSRGSVQRLLREAGIRRRRKSLTDTEVSRLVKRYEAGLTIREIAAEQGLAKTTVQDALARACDETRA